MVRGQKGSECQGTRAGISEFMNFGAKAHKSHLRGEGADSCGGPTRRRMTQAETISLRYLHVFKGFRTSLQVPAIEVLRPTIEVQGLL